jgi:hypothetical protein
LECIYTHAYTLAYTHAHMCRISCIPVRPSCAGQRGPSDARPRPVCVCVCVCVCDENMSMCVKPRECTHTITPGRNLHTCIHTNLHTLTNYHSHAHSELHVHVHTHTHTHTLMHSAPRRSGRASRCAAPCRPRTRSNAPAIPRHEGSRTGPNVRERVCLCVCVNICVCICTCTWYRMYEYICTYMHAHARVCVCAYREEVGGESHGLVDEARVEVNVGVKVLLDEVVVTQGGLLEGGGDLCM